MINKTYIPVIWTLVLVIFLSACGGITAPKSEKKKKAVFIFCDVTGSLIKAESEQVAKLTADILDRLPSDAVFKLIPVHMETDIAEAILETDNTIKSAKELPGNLKTERRNNIVTRINKLYEMVNRPEQKPERTCLLSGLGRAREFFVNLKSDEYEYELIFISDMIEHCQTTPAGRGITVSIKDQKPEEALTIIKSAMFPDFSNVRITVIIPGKDETILDGKIKPSKQVLNAFWSEVFKKCKNNKVTTDDWFTAKVPDRIFDSQTEQPQSEKMAMIR